MLNGMTVLRFENMPELARSGGKKTAQCTHCAVCDAVSSSLQLKYKRTVHHIYRGLKTLSLPGGTQKSSG